VAQGVGGQKDGRIETSGEGTVTVFRYNVGGGTAMPIHDWTRVRANRFHHFHQTWTANLAAALNSGRLPPGFFALAEQITVGPEADVVALELTPPAATPSLSEMAVAVAPPSARFVVRSEAANYARKADRISICLCELSPGSDVPVRLERLPGGTQAAAGRTWGRARNSVGREEDQLLGNLNIDRR
jgi:hypothetical protein